MVSFEFMSTHKWNRKWITSYAQHFIRIHYPDFQISEIIKKIQDFEKHLGIGNTRAFAAHTFILTHSHDGYVFGLIPAKYTYTYTKSIWNAVYKYY